VVRPAFIEQGAAAACPFGHLKHHDPRTCPWC
jgi:hypothetical protein